MISFNFLHSGLPLAQRLSLSAWLLLSCAALSSCGSGSSSTTELKNDLPSPVAGNINGEILVPAAAGREPTPQAELESLPLITLNKRQLADPNVLLSLHGTVTAKAGATIVKTLWTQVSGPEVRIPSPLKLNNEIIIPDVAQATTLEFRLTAQDSNNKINSDTLSVLVKPVPSFVKVVGGVFNESDSDAVFSLRLSEARNLPITFSYTTQDGSAKNGEDYVFTSGEVTLAAGELTTVIRVPLSDDALGENDETFSLQVATLDGDTAHSNRGIAIIHSETESLRPQAIQFIHPESASIAIKSQYDNPLASSPGTGAVIYTSSNPAVATVDASGRVTALAPGATTITAIKAGDAFYAPAEVSYPLQVLKGNTAPQVVIHLKPGQENGFSLKAGEPLTLEASVFDAEDGNILQSGPTSTIEWSSDIDGFLRDKVANFTAAELTARAHTITLSATDSDGNTASASALVFVDNLANLAIARDATTSPPCNADASAINDSNIATSLKPGCGAEAITYLTWETPVTFNHIDLYTSASLPLQNYTIDYFFSSREAWVEFVSSSTNFSLHHSYSVATITANRLRIRQPAPGIINEVAISNVILGSAEPTPSSSSALASSVKASSATVSSSRASSFAASSSRASSSLLSSSRPSSSRASSSVLSSPKPSSSRASSSKGVVVL